MKKYQITSNLKAYLNSSQGAGKELKELIDTMLAQIDADLRVSPSWEHTCRLQGQAQALSTLKATLFV